MFPKLVLLLPPKMLLLRLSSPLVKSLSPPGFPRELSLHSLLNKVKITFKSLILILEIFQIDLEDLETKKLFENIVCFIVLTHFMVNFIMNVL